MCHSSRRIAVAGWEWRRRRRVSVILSEMWFPRSKGRRRGAAWQLLQTACWAREARTQADERREGEKAARREPSHDRDARQPSAPARPGRRKRSLGCSTPAWSGAKRCSRGQSAGRSAGRSRTGVPRRGEGIRPALRRQPEPWGDPEDPVVGARAAAARGKRGMGAHPGSARARRDRTPARPGSEVLPVTGPFRLRPARAFPPAAVTGEADA